ncbi:MAG: Fpg/Nei family DNA glycosylase [Actinobacteria bacterium]|nr:Fpg/Nei family DNA glycosylase [Actinomycetota bacterium]MCA1722014.1 Fpg/Nei family DNA glycosylase [Actinomycetota bacterium]
MPELPEVEALVSFLREHAVGRVVARVDVAGMHALKTYDPPITSLAGLEVVGIARHGKFLDLDLSGIHLVVHLARAGWLHWKDALPPAPPRPGKGPLALRVHLDDGSGFDLTEAGTKKGLAVYVVRDVALVPGVARLGLDPLSPEFTVEFLAGLLGGERGQVKGVLTTQSLIAGLGNAYSDEVLWEVGLSPFKPAGNLTAEEVERLHGAIVTTLQSAVGRARGLAAKDLKSEKKLGLNVHARAGLPCPRCGDTIRDVSFASKSLQYCPTCQTDGKPLADRRLSRLLK